MAVALPGCCISNLSSASKSRTGLCSLSQYEARAVPDRAHSINTLKCLYTVLIVFLNVDATVETNLIDPHDIPKLTHDDIVRRTWGSKMVLLVEQCECAVQWGTKACLLILYWRLTQNLTQHVVVKVVAVYVVVTYVVMEVLYFGYWCRPFHDYWQTPTDNVQCTTALHHLITNLSFNLSSDLLIMSIPLPLFLKAQMDLKRKLLLILPFTMGVFTIICAILSKHLSFTQPFSAEWVFWYCREASTAMIVTNMPYSWALIRRAFGLKSFFGDSDSEHHDTIHGVSVREASVVSSRAQARNRSSIFFFGREEVKNSNGAPSAMSATYAHSWNKQSGLDEKATADIAAHHSTTSSSRGSVSKPPASHSTAAMLDRLYPLDDEDLELFEEQEKKRGNRRVSE